MNNNSCGRSEDILGYIYDELDQKDRGLFESHLVACTACTDEFAMISDARYSVFEWHKEEFVPLPTPEFSIPHVTVSHSDWRAPGFFAAIGEMIRGTGLAVQAAAGIVLFAGLTFVAFMFLSSNDPSVARQEATVPPAADEPEPRPEKLQVAALMDTTTEPEPGEVITEQRRKDPPIVEPRAPRRSSHRIQKARYVQTPMQRLSKAPVLSSFEEKEDRSLRLADLLDEVGG